MTTRKFWIKRPATQIEGFRVWVENEGGRKELSQTNGDGHGAAFLSAFDSEKKAIDAVRRFYGLSK